MIFPKQDTPGLPDEELRDRVLRLFSEQSTMTLATTDGAAAWAAPVYYVNSDFQIYFFSDPGSRHVLESQSAGHASAAVFTASSDWKEIRGVQMSGVVQPLFPGLEAAGAVSAYIKKFNFVREFFTSSQGLTLDAFSSRFKVRFYRFTPGNLYYLDNRVSFGFRAAVPLLQQSDST